MAHTDFRVHNMYLEISWTERIFLPQRTSLPSIYLTTSTYYITCNWFHYLHMMESDISVVMSLHFLHFSAKFCGVSFNKKNTWGCVSTEYRKLEEKYAQFQISVGSTSHNASFSFGVCSCSLLVCHLLLTQRMLFAAHTEYAICCSHRVCYLLLTLSILFATNTGYELLRVKQRHCINGGWSDVL